MSPRTYLLWFSNELSEFREPELRSVLSMLDVKCRWTPRSADEPFLEVEFDREEDAYAVARRTVTVKACLELWAAADTEEDLHEQLRRRLQHHPETMAAHLAADTYRISVDAFSKNFSYDDKMARIDAIADILPIAGSVLLQDPALCLQLLENYGPDSNRAPPRPFRLFFGRRLCVGPRATITEHSLKRRTYIGNTSMDPELALIMANMARVRPGRLVLDPFVGTGSLLVAAAHFGGHVIGADIDPATVHARTRPSRVQERGRPRGAQESIAANLRQYGLQSRLLDVLVADAARPAVWRRGVTVDAIVTDPPYGIREVSQVGYCAGALFGDLLQLAAERLPLGGRLVYWLPVARAEYTADRLPRHSCLRLVANSEQALTCRASRRLITMEKCREPTEAERGCSAATVHPSIDSFQERYYSAQAERTAGAPVSGVTGGGHRTPDGGVSGVTGERDRTVDGGVSGMTGGRDWPPDGGVSGMTGERDQTVDGGVSGVTGGWNRMTDSGVSDVLGGRDRTANDGVNSVTGGRDRTTDGGVSGITGGRDRTADGGVSGVTEGRDRTPDGGVSDVGSVDAADERCDCDTAPKMTIVQCCM